MPKTSADSFRYLRRVFNVTIKAIFASKVFHLIISFDASLFAASGGEKHHSNPVGIVFLTE